mmetsp:Transcript_63807/g.118574  ORF Transcript_63807/g.118574 Transcript_63807/m.118574 type:complete len:93 (+) Transcript_63807:97-375(+)
MEKLQLVVELLASTLRLSVLRQEAIHPAYCMLNYFIVLASSKASSSLISFLGSCTTIGALCSWLAENWFIAPTLVNDGGIPAFWCMPENPFT